jgi:predicted porin
MKKKVKEPTSGEFMESAPVSLPGPRLGVSLTGGSLAILVALLLSSCTHYYYVANVHNVPLFKEKNEYRISGSLGSGDESTCIEVQAAYSVTDKIGIMANYMSAKGGDVTSHNYGSGNYIDGAVGYYKPVGRFGVFETYGGLGLINQRHEYSSGSSDLSSLKFYIQPSFGFTSKFFDIAVSTRFSALTFNIKSNNISGNYELSNELNSLSTNVRYYFEPAITLRAGWQYTKLQFQAAYSGNIIHEDMQIGEDYHFSIGICFSFANRFKPQDHKQTK